MDGDTEPPLDPHTLDAYRRAEVTIHVDGAWRSAAELAIDAAPTPVHVLTAWNPFSTKLSAEENAERDARLEADLAAEPLTYHRARGFDPASSWTEEGFAVIGLTRDAARALGAAYDQHAIFEFTSNARFVVGCRDGWVL